MSTKPFTFIAIGLAWVAVAVYLMLGNVVLRETRLGIVVRFLDRLPSWASNPVSLCFWAILLLGWTVPLIVGFRLLRRNPRVR
jgi:hypothetical protein